MTLEELRKFKPQILAIAEKYGVTDICVFGSTARGDSTDKSDVDLLIGHKPQIRFSNIYNFQTDLEKMIKSNVEITFKKAVRDYQWKYIENDLKIL